MIPNHTLCLLGGVNTYCVSNWGGHLGPESFPPTTEREREREGEREREIEREIVLSLYFLASYNTPLSLSHSPLVATTRKIPRVQRKIQLCIPSQLKLAVQILRVNQVNNQSELII